MIILHYFVGPNQRYECLYGIQRVEAVVKPDFLYRHVGFRSSTR